MKTRLLIVLALVAAACGGGATPATPTAGAPGTEAGTTTASTTTEATTTTTEPTTTTEAAPGGAVFAIATVTFGQAPMVVITNVGDTSGNLEGHWLCQRPNYGRIGDVELAPGESAAISLGGEVFVPPPGAKTVDISQGVGTLDPASGELGLYSAGDFGNPDAIVAYVEWGKAGHGRTATAVQAGVWTSGGFVTTGDDTALISATEFPATGPDAWTSG